MKTYERGHLKRAFDFMRHSCDGDPVASSEVDHPEPAAFFSGRSWPDGWEIHDLQEPVFLAKTKILRLKKGNGQSEFELWAGGYVKKYTIASVPLAIITFGYPFESSSGPFTAPKFDVMDFVLISSKLTREEGLEIIEAFEESARVFVVEKAEEARMAIVEEAKEAKRNAIKEAKEQGIEIKKTNVLEERDSSETENVPVFDDRPRLEP